MQRIRPKHYLSLYEEMIRQIQQLNQKLSEQDIYMGGRDFYKVMNVGPFPNKKNILFAIALSSQQQYVIEFASDDMTAAELQKYLRRALFLMTLDRDKNIITAHDFCMNPAHSFVVMDWVHGYNLMGILKQQRLNLKECLWIIHDLTIALEHLAELNFVHRNINPNNIIIQQETKRIYLSGVEYLNVSDFAHSALDSAYSYYASPELMLSLENPDKNFGITPMSDIYSLGAVFYHIISGSTPPRVMPGWFSSGIPRIYNVMLTKRERRYCQELLNRTMNYDFSKRWTTTEIRNYILAYLQENERNNDLARWL